MIIKEKEFKIRNELAIEKSKYLIYYLLFFIGKIIIINQIIIIR